MANEENLKKGEPYRFRAGEEQREIARLGGIASGEARRRKKSMRQAAEMLMDMKLPKGATELRARLKMMGFNEDDLTYQNAVVTAVTNQAMKGNIRAAEFIRDTIGENPINELKERELDYKIEELEYRRMLDTEKKESSGDTDAVRIWAEKVMRMREEANDD